MGEQTITLAQALNESFPEAAAKIKAGKSPNKTEKIAITNVVYGFLVATEGFNAIDPLIHINFACGRSDRLFKNPEEEA